MKLNVIENLSNTTPNQTKGIILALLSAVIMSFDPIFIRFSKVEGLDTAFLFGLFAAISMLLLLQLTSEKGAVKTIKQQSKPLFISGLLMLFSAGGLIVSLQYTSVTNTFVIFCTSPILTSIFGRLLLKETISKNTMIVIAIVLIGVLILVSGSLNSVNLMGDCLALFSVASLSLNQTYLRKYQHVSRIATIAIGGLLLAMVLFWFVSPTDYGATTWLVMAAMGLFTAPLGRVLSQVAIRYITATEVSIILMLEAALAPLLAYWLLNEIPANQSIIGGSLIFIAILYFVSSNVNPNS